MRKIEKEEEQLAYDDPDRKIFHLCIVNLVIGYVTFIPLLLNPLTLRAAKSSLIVLIKSIRQKQDWETI